MTDKRFYGLYQGICINSDDPTKSGRITLQVPQLFGTSVTDWAPSVSGMPNMAQIAYGTFSDFTTQQVTDSNTATPLLFRVTEDARNTYVDPAHQSRVYTQQTGDYFFQFSCQFTKPSSSASQVDVWIRKNGIDIARSNSRSTMQGNPNELITTVGFILDLNAGEYLEVVMSSPDSTTAIEGITGLTSPTRPDIPGIIATLNLIANYKPNPGTPVWVMFIGGDPNFPVWSGT